MKRALAGGMREVECMDALGIPLQRLPKWQEEAQWIAATVVPEPVIPWPTESTALVPVARSWRSATAWRALRCPDAR